MGIKLPPDKLALYETLDEILFFKWDPIGISDMNWSRGEYYAYLPVVFNLVLENDEPEPIVSYLTEVRAYMGIDPCLDRDREIALVSIRAKKELLLNNWAQQ